MRQPIGGWTVSLEAAIRATAAEYDLTRYDNQEVYAQTAPASGWLNLDEYTESVDCGRGATRTQSPGAVADAGRLRADLYDPLRELDPTRTPYPDLLEPGAPIRLVARKDGAERPLWSGIIRRWEHDTLTGNGTLDAVDTIGRVAPFRLDALNRPAEAVPARLAAMLAVMPGAPPFQPTGTGTAPLCAAVLSGDMWQAMKGVVDTDQSWLWADAAGAIRWQNRGAHATASAQFVDWPDPGIPAAAVYVGMPTISDDEAIINEVRADRSRPEDQAPAPRLFVQTGSRDRHGPHGYDNLQLQLASDAEVDTWAARVLRLRAWPAEGPTQLKAVVHDDLDWAGPTMDTLTALEVGDQVRVRLTTRGPVQEWLATVGALDLQCTMDTLSATILLALPQEVGVGGYDAPSTRYDSTSAYDGTAPARRARRRARQKVFA